VSAVIMQNLPPWAEFIRTPSLDVALMGNWKKRSTGLRAAPPK